MIKKKVFKWVGGKKWIKEPLVEIVDNHFKNNDKIDTYIEPCAGGLGSFLSIAESLIKRGVKKVYLNDINEVLMSTFEDLYSKNVSLFEEYIIIEKEYESRIPKNYKEIKEGMTKEDIKENLERAKDYYISRRHEYNSIKNQKSLRRSALFIFLMQHSFNGVYRENKNGGFNTPYNWEPKIASQFNMKSIFEEYKHMFSHFEIKFSSSDIFDFFESLKKESINWNNAICYIDPPYMNKKNNELSYSAGGFSKDSQIILLGLIELTEIPNIIYTNYDFEVFREFAKRNNLRVRALSRNSRINPAKSKKICELLIYKLYETNSEEGVG